MSSPEKPKEESHVAGESEEKMGSAEKGVSLMTKYFRHNLGSVLGGILSPLSAAKEEAKHIVAKFGTDAVGCDNEIKKFFCAIDEGQFYAMAFVLCMCNRCAQA